ncbi:MAG: hypothetical protein INR63_18755 [Actinomycetospora chiangmaiensis]|nr:hypothetical protein [Actinomycetospora chiangmaiensis]
MAVQIELEDWLNEHAAKEAAAKEAARGNGGPPLEEPSTYEALAVIGKTMHGPLWEGKLADTIGESDRTLRRWRNGEGSPKPRTVAWAREAALAQAIKLLTVAGEHDLAGEALAALKARKAKAKEAGREAFAEVGAAVAKAVAEQAAAEQAAAAQASELDE